MSAKSLFISYSHADSSHLETLKTHIKPLERRGVISPWFDGHIIPGDDIDEKVGDALRQAQIVALLVSPDFLASDYCIHTELSEAIRRHQEGTARVIPIILRKCGWQEEPFGRLAGLPTDAKAIMSLHWADKDEAWDIVAKGIKAAASAEASEVSPALGETKPSNAPAPASLPKGATQSVPLSPMRVSRRRKLTDEERDDFKHQAFDEISQRFEASINALNGATSGRFRRLDANRFVATLYQSGSKKSGITVYVDGRHFGNGIKFHMSDDGRIDTMNGVLEVALNNGVPYLKSTMGSWMMGGNEYLDSQQAAERIWDSFVSRLE
ncbi:toll/interleukin-1 receptor domain-containing protein [Henriciella barbarensis]|uniref:Toll/interleukin-1 receptor domain-containing protein n=1 Tax=Henriciella barbarensis TaxID=86342 RepID=A0A399R316_9PROT|nr:toll/interleukin-1 receptor domain-containing protein [Henriciella barbarensis]RIJ24257.1 toll/interleukin-1 receptor domain-containing protein [Henriciella barbarensis]